MKRVLLTVTFLVMALASEARGQRAEGVVLEVKDGRVTVDLGTTDGVGAGARLLLVHTVTATHPVTGKTLEDHVPLGEMEAVKAGERVAVCRPPEALAARVVVGDRVRLVSEPQVLGDPWHEGGAGGPREAGPDPVAEAHRAFEATLGRPIAERLGIWRAYLVRHPNSPVAAAVRAEMKSLQEQQALAESFARREGGPRAERRDAFARLAELQPDLVLLGPVAMVPPERALEGTALDIVLAAVDPETAGSATLHYRRAGEPTFHRAELSREGATYRGSIPAHSVSPPGVEYFIEVARPDAGDAVPVLGSARAPTKVPVDAAVAFPPEPREGRSQVRVAVDLVDFDGGGAAGWDQYVQTDLDFGYRFLGPVHTVRLGFGTLNGKGGPKDVIDESPEDCLDENGDFRCRRISFHYAYVELELRASESFAFLVRPLSGVSFRQTRDASDRELGSALGLALGLRIGPESSTNLALGLSLTDGFGTLVEAAYTWDVIPGFPIVLGAQVTDQPVPEDFGVRLIADVGWRESGWFYPSLRLSYQARDLDHAGVSGGLGLNFDW